MNKILKFLLIIFPILFSTGCLQIETTVTVNKDGSGTIHETVLMSRMVADMLAEFSQSFDDSSANEEFSLFKEEELISAAGNYGEDVEYLSGEHISNDQWEGFKATYTFKDLNKVMLKPDPDNKVAIGLEEEASDEAGEYYFFKFTGGEIPMVSIDRPDIDSALSEGEIWEEEAEDESEEMDSQFVNMMEGMSILITMEFNGQIVETNASYVEGSKITLIGLDFGKLLQDKENLKLFKQKQPNSIEELKEMVEKVPGMKLELQKPVTVNFK